jgi:hypothetical protein
MHGSQRRAPRSCHDDTGAASVAQTNGIHCHRLHGLGSLHTRGMGLRKAKHSITSGSPINLAVTSKCTPSHHDEGAEIADRRGPEWVVGEVQLAQHVHGHPPEHLRGHGCSGDASLGHNKSHQIKSVFTMQQLAHQIGGNQQREWSTWTGAVLPLSPLRWPSSRRAPGDCDRQRLQEQQNECMQRVNSSTRRCGTPRPRPRASTAARTRRPAPCSASVRFRRGPGTAPCPCTRPAARAPMA